MFFSSLKMSKQKKPWEIAAFFRRKDETSHLLRASVVVSSAERSRRRLKVTRPNSRVPFITHFQYRWFLGAKAEMSISVSGYLGEAIFRPLPTIPSEKIGGVSEIFYIFTPKTWRKMSNLTIIFCRWVGEKFNHQRPKTLRQKTTLAMRPTSQATTGRMSMMTWKQVVDPEMMVWTWIWAFPKIGVPQNGWFIMENPIRIDDLGVPLFLETPICEEVDLKFHHRIHGKMVYLPTFFGWLLLWWDFSPLMWRNREWCP